MPQARHASGLKGAPLGLRKQHTDFMEDATAFAGGKAQPKAGADDPRLSRSIA